MENIGIENKIQPNLNIQSQGKYVVFQYTISILVMTFKRTSKIHFVKNKKIAFLKSLPYSLLTLLFGWWGIPWGPIYSIEGLYKNFSGGIDMTHLVQYYNKKHQEEASRL